MAEPEKGSKKPVNWWRVTALIAVPLCIYTIWCYAESEAKRRHLLEHIQGAEGHEDHDH